MSAERFLQQQTFGSIVRNTLAIYFGNWLTISLIYAIPMLPVTRRVPRPRPVRGPRAIRSSRIACINILPTTDSLPRPHPANPPIAERAAQFLPRRRHRMSATG